MACLRLTRALSKYGITRNDVWSSNTPRDSATSLVYTSKAAMQQQNFIHNAANFESKACQVPEVHLLGLQQANIGRDLTGSADAVMQIYGSWHKRSMTGGAAWIVKDEKLKSIDGGCLQSYASSSLQMEILACLHGIKWAKDRQIRNVHERGTDMMISKRSEQVIWSRVTLSLNIEEGPCPCMSCIVTFATSSTATMCQASAWHVG